MGDSKTVLARREKCTGYFIEYYSNRIREEDQGDLPSGG